MSILSVTGVVTSSLLALSACPGFASKAGGSSTTAASSESGAVETVSASDAAIIVQAAEDFMKDCGDCEAPGFDFTARTVKVSASDLAMRDKWIHDVLDPNGGSVHDAYAGALKSCEWTAPVIAVDIAVAKFWQVNKLAPPIANIFGSFSDSCGNPPNPSIKAFARKVIRIHIKVAPHWPKSCATNCGYEYSFDSTTGILDVGVHNHPVNLDVEADRWFKQQ